MHSIFDLKSSDVRLKILNYQYDGAGRLTNEGDKSYAYGWTDKVLSVVEGENTKIGFEYFADGQISGKITDNEKESFFWDGLALIKRDKIDYTIEPHPNGGNPILAEGKILFNDVLGNSLGTVENRVFSEISRLSGVIST